MQHSRFTEQQIAFVLEQVARGASVEETCRKAGIPVHTYYHWRTKYAGLKPSHIRQLQQIEDENKRLKQLVARLIAGKPAAASPAPGGRELLALPAPRPAPAPAAIPLTASARGPSHAAHLPKRQRAEGASQSRALVKIEPEAPPSKGRGARMLRDVGGRLAARGFKTWCHHKLLVLCFAGGLVGGFAMGLEPSAPDHDGARPVAVDMSLRANSYGAVASAMDKGWGPTEPWGRWMEGGVASMLIGSDGPARGDVELLIEARARLAQGQPEQTLIVRFNDAELGRWRLPREERQLRRRFIVPAAVFNRTTAGELTFALDGRAPLSPVFGLEAVSLRDARLLTGYRGALDSCGGGKLSGWAVAEGTAVSVTASAGGKPLEAMLSSLARPDLPAHGLPDDAGFELVALTGPMAAGSPIEVRFPNGRPLPGSPCTP